MKNEITITREAQGRSREAGSEGSVDQIGELTNRNSIGGSDSGRVGQGLQSPSGKTGRVNAVVAPGKYMGLPGEICTGGAALPCTDASDGGDIACVEVSRRHSSRGDERGVGRSTDDKCEARRITTDSRTDEGLKPYGIGTPMGNALINADRRESEHAYRIQTSITPILVWVKATAIKQTA